MNKVDILNKKTGGLLREDDYTPQLQLVGQRCGLSGFGSAFGANTQLNNHSKHLIPCGATAIKLIYSGMRILNGVPGCKPITPSIFSASNVTFSGGVG